MFSRLFGRKPAAPVSTPSVSAQAETAARVKEDKEEQSAQLAQQREAVAQQIEGLTDCGAIAGFIATQGDAGYRFAASQRLAKFVSEDRVIRSDIDQALDQALIATREKDRRAFKVLKEVADHRQAIKKARSDLASLTQRAEQLRDSQSASANRLVEVDREFAALDRAMLVASDVSKFEALRTSLSAMADSQGEKLRELNLLQRELSAATSMLAGMGAGTASEIAQQIAAQKQVLVGIDQRMQLAESQAMQVAHGNALDMAPTLRHGLANLKQELIADQDTVARLEASLAASQKREHALREYAKAIEAIGSEQTHEKERRSRGKVELKTELITEQATEQKPEGEQVAEPVAAEGVVDAPAPKAEKKDATLSPKALDKLLERTRRNAERALEGASYDRWLAEQQTRLKQLEQRHDQRLAAQTKKRDDAIVNAVKTIESQVEPWQAALADGQSAKAQSFADRTDQALHTLQNLQASGKLSRAVGERIVELKSETMRFKEWKHFGGAVSRESLLEEAEKLAAASLGEHALTKEIARMRGHWQQIDKAQGGAGRALWDKFNAALETAYAPVKAQHKQERARRTENLSTREALCAQVEARASDDATLPKPGMSGAAWPAFIREVETFERNWRQMGPLQFTVPKAQQDAITSRFDAALKPLQALIDDARNIEKLKREKLITQATELGKSATSKDAVDNVKALRERWNDASRTLQLSRKDEQTLYDRFNGALSAVFGARDDARKAEIAQGEAAATERDGIVAKLQEAVAASGNAVEGITPEQRLKQLETAFGQAKAQWHQAPDVHPKVAKPLNDKFKTASTYAQKAVEALSETVRRASNERLAAAIALFAEVDADLPQRLSAQLTAQPVGKPYNEALKQWASRVASNPQQVGDVDEALLDLEIARHIESPAEFKDARLKRSVAWLATAMREGKQAQGDTKSKSDAALLAIFKRAGQLSSDEVTRIRKSLT